jgi:hypothetical protein
MVSTAPPPTGRPRPAAAALGAVVLVLALAGCGTGERRASPTTAPRTAASGGPCSPGPAGPECSSPPSLAAVMPSPADVSRLVPEMRMRHQATVRRTSLGYAPGCDQRPVRLVGPVDTARAAYYARWSSWVPHAPHQRYTLEQITARYATPAARDTDWRRLMDSPCQGDRRIYRRSSGTVGGWARDTRVQVMRCERGGLCPMITDYVRRGRLLVVQAVTEGTAGQMQPSALLRRGADRYRDALLARLTAARLDA